MAYIQVELMAVEHADFVAQTLGCRKVEILGGLVELWQFSWKRCEDIHQTSVLQAWFAFEPSKTLLALEAFGFAEDLKNGTFRVRGAERYLRIRQQRAAAGKKGGLKRAEKAAKQLASTSRAPAKQVPNKSLAIASNDENDPKTEPENEAEIKQVLSKSLASAKQALSKSLKGAKQVSGNTEHRSQSTEHRQQNTEEKNIVADATGAKGIHQKVTQKLIEAYEQVRGSKYLHQKGKDGVALKELLAIATEDEILARWRKGLNATGWHNVSTFAQLRQKWNDLAQTAGINQQLTTPEKKLKTALTQEQIKKQYEPVDTKTYSPALKHQFGLPLSDEEKETLRQMGIAV